jgi:outer membrane receptor protein involved in Fe transport
VGGNKLKIGKIMNVSQAWKIPTGGSWDLRASYDFTIKDIRFTLYGIVNNILNQYYIEKAWNPSNISTNIIEVNPADVYMFYSQGTTWNVKLKVEL